MVLFADKDTHIRSKVQGFNVCGFSVQRFRKRNLKVKSLNGEGGKEFYPQIAQIYADKKEEDKDLTGDDGPIKCNLRITSEC